MCFKSKKAKCDDKQGSTDDVELGLMSDEETNTNKTSKPNLDDIAHVAKKNIVILPSLGSEEVDEEYSEDEDYEEEPPEKWIVPTQTDLENSIKKSAWLLKILSGVMIIVGGGLMYKVYTEWELDFMMQLTIYGIFGSGGGWVLAGLYAQECLHSLKRSEFAVLSAWLTFLLWAGGMVAWETVTFSSAILSQKAEYYLVNNPTAPWTQEELYAAAEAKIHLLGGLFCPCLGGVTVVSYLASSITYSIHMHHRKIGGAFKHNSMVAEIQEEQAEAKVQRDKEARERAAAQRLRKLKIAMKAKKLADKIKQKKQRQQALQKAKMVAAAQNRFKIQELLNKAKARRMGRTGQTGAATPSTPPQPQLVRKSTNVFSPQISDVMPGLGPASARTTSNRPPTTHLASLAPLRQLQFGGSNAGMEVGMGVDTNGGMDMTKGGMDFDSNGRIDVGPYERMGMDVVRTEQIHVSE